MKMVESALYRLEGGLIGDFYEFFTEEFQGEEIPKQRTTCNGISTQMQTRHNISMDIILNWKQTQSTESVSTGYNRVKTNRLKKLNRGN